MGQIIWTPQAQKDLKQIYNFIAEDSNTYARREIKNIHSRANVLKTFQEAGKKYSELNDPKLREIVYSHYRIIYRIVNDARVDILVVHHGARSISKRKLKL